MPAVRVIVPLVVGVQVKDPQLVEYEEAHHARSRAAINGRSPFGFRSVRGPPGRPQPSLKTPG